MRQYRDWIVGILVYLVAFAALYAATKSIVLALVLAAVFGVAAGLLMYSLLPADPELVKYRADVRRRVRTVLQTTDQIAELAQNVKDPKARLPLIKACSTIRDLLDLAQQKDPDNMASTAAKVGVYIGSVKSAVDAQVQIEAHPEYWPNADQLLASNAEGFANFENFAVSSVQHLNQGEVTTLRANLKMLQPMTIPALST
jgi:hypothetical protein